MFVVALIPVLIYGQQREKPEFEVGLIGSTEFYPGVRIMPTTGPDIMKSQVTLGWGTGFSIQYNSKNKYSVAFNTIFSSESHLKTLGFNYDLLFSLNSNINTGSIRQLFSRGPDIIFFFSLQYKHYLNNKGFYLLTGADLISPTGLITGAIHSTEIYDELSKTNKNINLFYNYQVHNIPFKNFYSGFEVGIGFRKDWKYINTDFHISFLHHTPYYYGEYGSFPESPIIASGFYIQKNFIIQPGVVFYLKTIKKIKNESNKRI